MSDGGKGDKRRPTDDAAYAEGWERIWGQRDSVAAYPSPSCTATSEQFGESPSVGE